MKAKNGISLIVLVITIVVIIILAAAVILSLGNNNPINSSKVAKLTQSKDNIESAISIYVSSQYAKTAGGDTDVDSKSIALGSFCKASSGDATPVENKALASAPTEAVSTDIYTITDFSALEIDNPGDTWYYAPATGKVYVEFTSTPSWATDATNAFTVVAKQ